MKKPSFIWYLTKSILTMAWAMPFVLAALICFASIVAIPVGFVFMTIGCAPFYHVQQKRVRKLVHYEMRDRPLYGDDEREKPWLMG